MTPVDYADEQARLRRMRAASLLEGSTLVVLLFVAVPLRHLAGLPIATRILMIKLVFVVLLSALHGMMSGMLRRAVKGGARPMASFLQHFPAAIVVSAIAIALLVVIKPFAG